ncbi:WbqC family protein [Actimicrobium antarcticum]|uniref:WbqC family protein n=1 Tax=Actimicrobium antarcticum TaxID=1051899 RepID=A0ABP7SRQ2_9BURK
MIASVDQLILYDNIKYTKKGWINRNRILSNGVDAIFTLPLEKNSDFLQIRERNLSGDFNPDKILNKLKYSYGKAPFFNSAFPLIERIIEYENFNLFNFIFNSINIICQYLNISTELKISSSIEINHDLKGRDKVLALCVESKSDFYVNAIGGVDLYSKKDFLTQGIDLKFIKSKNFEYPQFDEKFISSLSIVDVLMFNSVDVIKKHIDYGYELI